MFAWFLWGQRVIIILLSGCLTILFALTGKEIFCNEKSNTIPVFFIIIIQLYVAKIDNVNGLIGALLSIVILSAVLLLNDQIKINLFQFFTRAFSIVLAISLLAWIFFLLGISLPHSHTNFNNGEYSFDNYYFFLLNNNYLIIPRFSSVFLEPGHMGMISSFLLFANRFDLKNKNVLIIFICTLLTFSLAAYVLLLISVSAYIILNSRKPFRNLILWSVCVFILFSFFANYRDGNNAINNLILMRLKIENGDIVGNNRVGRDFDDYFQQFMNSDNKFLGIGEAKYSKMIWKSGNAGYKVFILQQGIFGTVLLFLLYFSMVIFKKSKLSLMFLVVYILSFLQRAYALWDVELLIFITALPILFNIKNETDV
jgi:hypothetical protein